MKAERFGTAVCCALYLGLFHFAYSHFVSVDYPYMGYAYQAPQPWLLVFGIAAALLPALWLPTRLRRPSQVVYLILYLAVYVPSIMVPIYTIYKIGRSPISLIIALVIAFFLLGMFYRFPLPRIGALRIPPALFWLVVLLVSAANYALILGTFGLHIRVISLLDVYGVRAEYKDSLGSGLVAYAVSWQAYVFNPLFIAYGLHRRRTIAWSAGILGQALLFSITGLKSIFFSAALIAALVLILRRDTNLARRMALGAAALIALSIVIQSLTGSGLLMSLFVRRTIATPGLLTTEYHDFFSEHPKAVLDHSILGPFVESPYTSAPPQIIGSKYFGQGLTANANLWADGFANFGYWGVLGASILLGVVFMLYDGVSRTRPKMLVTLLLAVPALVLSNAALLTALMTHGIGLAILLAYASPIDDDATEVESPAADRPHLVGATRMVEGAR